MPEECNDMLILTGYGGGMAHKIVAPAGHFYTLPDKVSLETASLIEPLAVSWHAVHSSPFKKGDSVLIVGGGPIGLGIVQVLKLQGAGQIIVAEPMDNRKKFCTDYGATAILDPGEVDVTKRVRELTGDVGADVVFDTAGVEKALPGAIAAVRVQGTIVNLAVWEGNPSLPVNDLMYKEVRYMGAALYDEQSFLDVIQALNAGECYLDAMIVEFF
jgi:threonine dehydrogenase-like Zn-dependent dehydrogenase